MNLRESTLDLARYFVGIHEVGGANRGAWVEAFQSAAQIHPGDPWCMAFVNALAERAAARLGVKSPLEKMALQGYVASLVETFPSVSAKDALPGDLIAFWNTGLGRHAHVGIIEERSGSGFVTIEGNTNAAGGREGIEVARKLRDLFPKDKIIRWTRSVELD